ncbi:MAG: rRNA maturation RNase YbeY [Desulfuromonas sp.]|nr:MAG: rRNA maturation RNase YbeY [Desulfuromonas sp.]
MLKIAIENQQRKVRLLKRPLRKAARTILSASGCPEARLSVLIVDDAQIRELNRDYLGKDRPTNVISFAMQEGAGAGVQPDLLGDVVISAETAARDAAEAGIAVDQEICFLLLHGILHLLGYDHERGTEEEARLMEQREQELFALVRSQMVS